MILRIPTASIKSCLAPSTSAVEFPEPPTKKRISLVNMINDTIKDRDYKDLGLHLSVPALTPRVNPDRTFKLEASLTDQRLASVSRTLSKELPVLSADDVISVVGSPPTPVRDEPILAKDLQYLEHNNIYSNNSSSSNDTSSSDSNMSTSNNSSDSTSTVDTPTYQNSSTMTDPISTHSVHTTTNIQTHCEQGTQTNTSYLSSASIIGTERYRVEHNVLRAFIYMFNELDSNLAVDFARMINRNF